MDDILQEYRDALIKLDELSLMLGHALSYMRIGWDEDNGEQSTCLNPINDIARQIGAAIPSSIKETRSMLPKEYQRTGRWMETPLKLA